jgi:hypothetical protein
MVHEMPNEVLLPEQELAAYQGLKEIRFRHDGKLAIGLFLRDQDKAPVVTLADRDSREAPYVFEVEPSIANSAFEGPYPYAPLDAQVMMQDVLARPDASTSQAA